MITISESMLYFFERLIQSSCAATILLLLILAIRTVVKRQFHVRMTYWLWILLLLRLIWPFQLQTTFSLFNLIPQQIRTETYLPAQTTKEEQVSQAVTDSRLTKPEFGDFEPSVVLPQEPVYTYPVKVQAVAGNDVVHWMFAVWLAGVSLLGGWILVSNLRLWRIVKGERLVTRQAILELLEDCKSQIGLQTVIGIVETNKVSTPCLFGYLRPRLLLPAGTLDELDARQMRYVFIHELAHLKRNDILIGWLMAAAQVLHWFNPVVWFAMTQISADRELACDEQALSCLGESECKAYGSTILKFLERYAGRQKVPAMAGIAENKSLLKRRIKMIAKFKNQKKSWAPVLVVMALLAGMTFTSSRDAAAAEPNQITGDGSKPDSAAFPVTDVGSRGLQTAIDAAQEGATVEIPAGVYDQPVRVTRSLFLKGASRDECVFKVTANEPAIFIDTAGKGTVQLADITIQWQLATSDQPEYPFAVAVKDTTTEINNCVFRPIGNFQRSPVAVRSIGFSEMMIKDCDFEGFDYVVCYGEGTKGRMEGCFVRDCGHQGVILYSGATAEIIGNIFSGSGFHAVRTTGGTLLMRNNLVINNKNRGVYVGNKSCQGTIENNLLIGNGTGIDAISASRFGITNNVILKSEYAGISAIPQAQLAISGNVLANNARGIMLHVQEGQPDAIQSEITANVFWNNTSDTENVQSPDAIRKEPDFVDAANGNFTLTDSEFARMGLKDSKALFLLWQKYKKAQ